MTRPLALSTALILALALGLVLWGCHGAPRSGPRIFSPVPSKAMARVIEKRRQEVADVVATGFRIEKKRLFFLPGKTVRVPDQPCPDCRRGRHARCRTDYDWMPNAFECTCEH